MIRTKSNAMLVGIFVGALALGRDGGRPVQTNHKMDLWVQPATLRGANVIVTASHVPTSDDFRSLKSAGANLVVLSASGIQQKASPFGYDSIADARLFNAVSTAEKSGLWVVIAIRTGPGLEDIAVETRTSGLQSRLWVDGTARREFVQMWQRIAAAFSKDSQVIGYDLIVEPYPEAAIEGLNTCCATISDTALARRGINWLDFADTVTMVIRQSDSTTPVIIGATGFALPPFFANLRPVRDRYVVYDVHQYEPHTYTHEGNPGVPVQLKWPGSPFDYWRDRTRDTLNPAWLRRVLTPVVAFQKRAGGPPILVGEFGVNREAPGAPAFIQSETALFDSLGWHGAMWAWNCCGSMAVSPSDSGAADPQRRLILRAYRQYWSQRLTEMGASHNN